MTLFAISFALLAAATIAGAAMRGRWRSLVAAGCMLGATALVAAAAVAVIETGATVAVTPAPLAILGLMAFVLSPLRALFMLVTAGVFASSIAFAVRDAEMYPPARAALFIGLIAQLFAAMLAVFAAGGVVSFVFAWEVAALAIWALVTFDIRAKTPVAAGLLTLVLSEVGTLAGMAGLFLLAAAAGSTRFAALTHAAAGLAGGIATAACVLTLFGFGVKAGIVPLNLWLPPAHGSAPRAISPILSGATLNLGIFAIVLIDGPLASHRPPLGLLILVMGAATALVGIIYALTERDLKRLLAQSSVENLGIVIAALGAGFAFLSFGKPALGGIALVAGLYHMVNHSTYKTLLFLGAGAVDAATGTHDLDRLGGLARRAPLLGTLFLIGALAIAALPPLNGFASEWLTLQAMLRVVEIAPVSGRMVFAVAAAALALTTGLAVTCFIMVFGSGFLGLPRSAQAMRPRATPVTALAPMGLLAALCLGLGVLATGLIPIFGRLVRPLTGVDTTAALAPAFFQFTPAAPHGVSPDLAHALTPLGAQLGRGILPLRGLVVLHSGANTPVVFAMSTALTFAVVGLILALVWLAARARKRRGLARDRSWNAGLYRLRPDMSYTASAFAAPVRVVFDKLLRPAVAEQTEQHGAFTTAIRRRTRLVHIADRLTLTPLRAATQETAALLARMHHGAVTLYAGYVLGALVVVLLIGKMSL